MHPVSGSSARCDDGFSEMFGNDCVKTSNHKVVYRIGEASHPGPLEITVCNVTGLNEKSIDICRWSGSLCGIAETAATESVIRKESNRVRQLKKHIFHGKPVAPNQKGKNGVDSLKGKPRGVAFLTGLPFRTATQWSKLTSWQACRLVVGYVRIANIDALAITVYGFQRNFPDANALNGELHSQVLSIIDTWKGPSIVFGDFNFDMSSSTIYQHGYQHVGLFDVRILAKRKTNVDIGPTTCQTSVTDSILVSKWFAERFIDAWVQHDSGLATHAPVHATFDISLTQLHDFEWKLPIPFKHLPSQEQINVAWSQGKVDFELQFQKALQEGDPDKIFTTWSEISERCIDAANKIGVTPNKCGSRKTSNKQFGRGLIPVIGPVSHHGLAKKPRQGDFSPEFEAISILAKQRVKQTRRLTSLHQRINHQIKKGTPYINNCNQLEWTKILHSRGYGQSFVKWVIDHTDIDYVPLCLPDASYIVRLQQRVQVDCDSLCKKQFRARSQHFKKTLQLDWAKGGKITFDIMAHRTHGDFHAMLVPVTVSATRLRWVRKGVVTLKLDEHVFDLGADFKVFHNEVEFTVCSFRDNIIEAKIPSQHCESIGPRIELCIHRWVYSSDEMARGFFKYWEQFWERDDTVENQDHWIEAMRHIDSIQSFDTAEINIETKDIVDSIASTPSRSAKGLCGWSIKEVKVLPESIIQLLVVAMNAFISTRWPRIFSLVKVALPPKVSHPCRPKDGRPIAIMSQIYRVLTKPLAKKILIHFANKMPRSIAGGLPGRDTMDIWYTIQHYVERAIYKQEHLCGFCLDIQKCFNAIGRYPAMKALAKLGVPKNVIECWAEMLHHLQRSVQIAGSCSQMHRSTTGIPEGDPMTVPCMVAICYIWHQHISMSGNSIPWSFADNWEVVSDSTNDLSNTIREILDFLRAWKLKADVGKSWCWSTNKLTPEDNQSLTNVCGDLGTIPFVVSQKDLGAQMKYKRTQFLGSTRERFDKAILRAQRLMSIPGTHEQKWRALKLGVSSVALFGIEIASIGWHHYHKLRSCFADVLAEGRGNRNEWLACHLTDNSSGDPETAAIKKCFKAARRFLIHYPQHTQEFCTLLFHAGSGTHSACGPSSTLKRWISRLGWKVIPSGKILTDNQIVVDLVTTPLEYIEQQVIASWTNKVMLEISHRQGLNDIPNSNVQATVSSLSKFGDIDRKICVKHIMGAYVCANKAKHWQDHDGKCTLCNTGQTDSMYHRVFDCPTFDQVRIPFSSILKDVKENVPYWPYSPTIPVHPDETRLMQICSLFPINLLTDDQLSYGDHQRTYTFYTDGGCSFPDCPGASIASWSIVGDDFDNNQDRHQAGLRYQNEKSWPSSLRLVAKGNIPNRQTNDRGELMAIVQCLSLAKYKAFIWSDSTYALDTLDKVLSCNGDLSRLQHCRNWDLVLHLVSVVNLRTTSDIGFNHIKAHESLDSDRHPIVQYHLLGNHLADHYATISLQETSEDLKTISAGIGEHYVSSKTLHQGYLAFVCQLTKATSTFNHGGIFGSGDDDNAYTEDGSKVCEPTKIVKLKEWTISNESQKFPCDIDQEVFSCVPHPPRFTCAVISWLRSLEWPTSKCQGDIGITWYELLIDLCISTACYPPIAQGKWKGQYLYTEVFQGSASSLLEHPVKDQIAALRSCIRAVAAMHGSEVFPMSFFTKDCKSLLSFPGGRQSSGLTIRPRLANPSETVDTVARLLSKGGFEIDRSKPHLAVAFVASNSNCQSRITSFKKAKERLRR